MVKVLINQKTLIILNQLKVWVKDYLKDASPQNGALWFSKYVHILDLCKRQGGEYPSHFKNVEPEAGRENVISSLVIAPFQQNHDLASGLSTPQL